MNRKFHTFRIHNETSRRFYKTSGNYLPASHSNVPDWTLGQILRDLWWTKCLRCRITPSTRSHKQLASNAFDTPVQLASNAFDTPVTKGFSPPPRLLVLSLPGFTCSEAFRSVGTLMMRCKLSLIKCISPDSLSHSLSASHSKRASVRLSIQFHSVSQV
jgi:hypothetical protein